MNSQKLKGKIVELNTTQEDIANLLGMSRTTFYRKMKSGKFTVSEAKSIALELKLDDCEAVEIFFGRKVAEMQLN